MRKKKGKEGQRTMYRLVVSLGRVQTALPNCYGYDHQDRTPGRVRYKVEEREAQRTH